MPTSTIDQPILTLQQLFTELSIFHLLGEPPHSKYQTQLHNRLELATPADYRKARELIEGLPSTKIMRGPRFGLHDHIMSIRHYARMYRLDVTEVTKLGSYDPWTDQWVWNQEVSK
jgi:hypothetical protein